jgi:hypothetical protein
MQRSPLRERPPVRVICSTNYLFHLQIDDSTPPVLTLRPSLGCGGKSFVFHRAVKQRQTVVRSSCQMLAAMRLSAETCSICGCVLHRTAGAYARPTVDGRSHASQHHFVAERFFGRSSNRRGTKTKGVFSSCPWNVEGQSAIFCFECHEELLHNPVFLREDIVAFARLVEERGLSELQKSDDRSALAGRVRLLHEVIATGLKALSSKQNGG